ncbi:DMT family transporter [Leucobacter sp. NPDC015123]|uniref:DMT family transporter n=1 Tax=Leucobacter sp. NPDC015123 TaxID=3364129 RepID=UPI0036F4AA15
MAQPSKNRTTILTYSALALIWGSSFLLMKLGLVGLSPGQVALGRIALGACTLAAIMRLTRRRWPRERRVWAHMIVIGATLCTIPFTLFAWAETVLPTTVASIANATTPIMTLLLTPLLIPAEKLSRRQSIGLVTGIIGVAVLVAPWRYLAADGSVSLPGLAACLAATLCYGFGGLYMRKFLSRTGLDAVTAAAMQLTTASLLALAAAPLISLEPVRLTPSVIAAMLALGILGSGVAYIWYTGIIRAWGPARASTVTYLTPVVGVTLGVAVLGESVHWNEPVGGGVIVLGVLASQGLFDRRKRHGDTPPVASPAALR